MQQSSDSGLRRLVLYGICPLRAVLMVSCMPKGLEVIFGSIRICGSILSAATVLIGFSLAGKLRGFAFASFTCRADAERAIALLNQQASCQCLQP